jgi:hypothetical protein
MITLQDLTNKINEKLNVIKEDIDGLQDVDFMIYPDGDEYKGARLENNAIKDNYIQGTAILLNSSIVPVEGIIIQSQTVGVEIVVPVKTGRELVEQDDGSSIMQEVVYQSSFEPIRQVLATLASQAYNDTIESDSKTFKVTYTVTNPRAGDIMFRAQVGLSITYQFTCNFAIIQNGVNTRDVEILFERVKVPFSQFSIVRTAINESGAFNSSAGSALNYTAVTAVQIDLSVPALSDSRITAEHFDFLKDGIVKQYEVSIKFGASDTPKIFTMQFGECNVSGQGTDNIGQSIRLVEALEIEKQDIE